nr:immunoglobulin light chain junction region [Macaca mulatta]MPN96596.1 immunoglobulin light chain junction region [Macaca mulatta]
CQQHSNWPQLSF